MTVDATGGDYLLLVFADEDKLYLPADRLGLLQRYKGPEGINPPLDRLGGSRWKSVRERAKKAIERIAADLVEMYAYRQVAKGYAYGPTNELYLEFEATFGFEETPDQERAIAEVLADMITDILIEKEAERLKVTVSETELDSQIDELKKKNNLTQQQLKDELAKEGLTLKQFREKMREDNIKKRLLGYMVHRKVLVTDDEVRDYYEKNKGALPTQKSVLGTTVSGHIGFLMYLQQKDSVYDLAWNGDVTYGQIYQRSEYEHSRYNFEESDAAMWSFVLIYSYVVLPIARKAW